MSSQRREREREREKQRQRERERVRDRERGRERTTRFFVSFAPLSLSLTLVPTDQLSFSTLFAERIQKLWKLGWTAE